MSDDNINENEQPSFRRYVARPKICQFCADKNTLIDYKQGDFRATIEANVLVAGADPAVGVLVHLSHFVKARWIFAPVAGQ